MADIFDRISTQGGDIFDRISAPQPGPGGLLPVPELDTSKVLLEPDQPGGPEYVSREKAERGAAELHPLTKGLTSGSLRTVGAAYGTAAYATKFNPRGVGGFGATGFFERYQPAAERTAEKLEQKAQTYYEAAANPKFALPENASWPEYVAHTVGQTAPMMGAAVTAGAIAGPAGAFLVGASVEGDAAYREALEDLKGRTDLTQAQKEDIANSERLITGTLNGAIELLQTGKILKFAEGKSPKTLVKIAKRIIGDKLAKLGARPGADLLVTMIGEGLEEAAQEAVTMGVAKIGHDKEFAPGEIEARLKESFVGGAAAGGAFAGGGRLATAAGRKMTAASVKEEVKERVKRGEFVPRRALEVYRGEGWADAALKQRQEEVEARQPETIIGPVIVRASDGKIFRGLTHGHIFAEHEGELTETDLDNSDLFETSTGRIVNSKEAARIADAASQRVARMEAETPLIAEDLLLKQEVDAVLKQRQEEVESSVAVENTLNQNVDPVKRLPAKLRPDPVDAEVQEELGLGEMDATVERENAAAVIDQYYSEHDVEKERIKNRVMLMRERLAEALGKKKYRPNTDVSARDMSEAMMAYVDRQQYPEHIQFLDKLSEEKKRIHELSLNLSPELQAIADEISALLAESGQRGLDEGILQNTLEHYIPHLWETEKRGGWFSKFRQKTPLARQRTLNTGGIYEGWAKGMDLRVKDITTAMKIAMDHVNQSIVGKHLIRLAKDYGLVSSKRDAGEGWVELKHNQFTTWKYAGQVESIADAPIKAGMLVRAADRNNIGKVIGVEGETAKVHFRNKEAGTEQTVSLPLDSLKAIRSYGENFFVAEDGALMERVKLWAHPELGKKLNKVFESSKVREYAIGRFALRHNALFKTTVLFTSLFHHQALTRSLMFGSRRVDPYKAYEDGKRAVRNLEPHFLLLVKNGFTAGEIQDYDPELVHSNKSIWGRALSLTKPGEKVHNAILNLRDANEQFLFGKYGPYLKTGAAISELLHLIKKNKVRLESGEITEDDLAKQVAGLMNADFGGLHLGRLGRSQTAQDMFHLLCLAPDWTESNIRSMIGAFRRGDEGRLYRAFWGRIAMKGLGATIALNLLMSAFDDEDDFIERYRKAWKAGELRWLEVDVTLLARALGSDNGSQKYFNLLGHFKDPIKFIFSTGRSAKHKGSILTRFVLDYFTGTNWQGKSFTDIGELTGLSEEGKYKGQLTRWEFGGGGVVSHAETPSFLAHEVRSTLPIQIQNALAFMGGEMDAFDALTKSLGFATATQKPFEEQPSRRARRRRRRRERKRR